MQQKKVRNSSIELLRMMAMILIVFSHFAVHGGFAFDTSVSIPRFWHSLISMGGTVGVNVFVLISGYYLITNEKKLFDMNKVVKFVGQVLFYSVVFYAVGVLTGAVEFGARSFIEAFFPITFAKWWFARAYFLLYLVHPFLNKLLLHIEQAVYQKLLALLVICWSVIPTFTTSFYGANELVWFVTLYSIAGYIRLYGLNSRFTTKHYLTGYLRGSAFTYATSVVFMVLGSRWAVFDQFTTYFFAREKVTTLFTAVCLFMVFATMNMNYHKWVNLAASATFGVYLIHDNQTMRVLLWERLFHNAQYQDSLMLIPLSIVAVAIVYAGCTCIDLLRQHLVEKPFMTLAGRCSEENVIPFEKYVRLLKDFIYGK